VRKHGIEIAGNEHLGQRSLGNDGEAIAGGQLQRDLFPPARLVHARLVPMDRGEVDAIFMGDEPRDRGRGLRPFGHAGCAFRELLGAVTPSVRT
jgi:hypothetical protein